LCDLRRHGVTPPLSAAACAEGILHFDHIAAIGHLVAAGERRN
jgi:hypothetical protein